MDREQNQNKKRVNPMKEKYSEFKQRKADYLAEKKNLDELYKEKTKTLNIIAAFEQDLAEQARQAHNKLKECNFITADEYIALKQNETGNKARIEYYKAYLEELEDKIYHKKETLFTMRKKAEHFRQEMLTQEFLTLFDTFTTEQKDVLNRLYLLLKYSGMAQPNISIDGYKGTIEFATKTLLFEKIASIINSDMKLDESLLLPHFIEASELKTPAQKHIESYSKDKKGFEKLIENLI
ncbi:hypothetical protein [Gallibacterium anatis]|uniref:hypothetical protein n=1 Tax=Gallibacterium anatis TaxID=750 RepID=UPI003003C17E